MVLRFVSIIDKSHIAKSVLVLNFVCIIMKGQNANIVVVPRFASIKEGGHNVKTAMVLAFVCMVVSGQDV